MPYSTTEKKRAGNKAWRDRKMAEGYGKALYARRAQRFRNEETLRAAIREALGPVSLAKTREILRRALIEAPEVTEPLDYMPSPTTIGGE
jgi:hypothetical protein